jgi:hypothetical protein
MANIHTTQNIRFFKAKNDIKRQLSEITRLYRKLIRDFQWMNNGYIDEDSWVYRTMKLNRKIFLLQQNLNSQAMEESENNNPFFRFRQNVN